MTNGICPLLLVDFVQGKHDQPNGSLIRQPI